LPSAAAQPARFVALEPAIGSLETVFTVTGTGFLPGEAAVHTFIAPDGTALPPRGEPGALQLADEQGVFQFQFVPASDFAAPVPGEWKLTVCLTDRRTCATLAFTVLG
jgi:hypothetical protein